jgi:hypothetical protein
VINRLATKIRWLDASGRTVGTFAPPADYIQFVTARYCACLISDCGA